MSGVAQQQRLVDRMLLGPAGPTEQPEGGSARASSNRPARQVLTGAGPVAPAGPTEESTPEVKPSPRGEAKTPGRPAMTGPVGPARHTHAVATKNEDERNGEKHKFTPRRRTLYR